MHIYSMYILELGARCTSVDFQLAAPNAIPFTLHRPVRDLRAARDSGYNLYKQYFQ